jgi:hypothetical protein
MNAADLWTDQWTTKLVDFLSRIRLRGASRGCRNLLRTSAREGGAGTEPRIHTVRQLTAAAGDGLLGSVGSPGQLETSLNSGYQWAPATHTWRGPHPFFGCCSRRLVWALLLAQSRLESAAVVVARGGRTPPLAPPPCGGARFSDARSPRGCSRSDRARLPTLAAAARDFPTARSPRGCSRSDRARYRRSQPEFGARFADAGGLRASPAPTGRRNSRAAGV